jgi:hypothetical protein
MLTNRFLLSALAVLLVAGVVGCSDDTPTGTALTPDESAIVDLVSGASVFGHDVVSHLVPDTTAGAGAQTFWWREYTTSDAQTDFEFFDADQQVAYPYAVVTLTSTFSGNLHVVDRDAGGVYTHTTKALVDVFTQTARFEQQFLETSPNRGWVLAAISNIVGGSSPSTLSIDNVTFDASTSPDVALTSGAMSTLYPLANRYTLEIDEQVSVILQSGSGVNDSYLHDAYAADITTFAMSNQDYGWYSLQVNAPTPLTTADAQRTLVIDVLADGVVDGATPYDAKIWAVPYVVDLGGGAPN